MKTLALQPNLTWVGVQDPNLRTFDIIMRTEYGTTYNAYLLRGEEKTVLFETAKAKFADAFFEKLASVADPASIDYLVVSHTEPDHAGSVERLLDMNPNLTVVGTVAALNFLKQIVNRDFNSKVAKDNDTLPIGGATLKFLALPNLHWPDTMFTYIEERGLLVTCDAFGAHFATEGVLRSAVRDGTEAYLAAMRYYFDMILGPFKRPFVVNAIERVRGLDVRMVLTGHGPVLDNGLSEVLPLYEKWCEAPEKTKKRVVIPYVSAYGYTRALAGAVAAGVRAAGDIDANLYDMETADASAVLSDLEHADGLLLGSPTILGDALAPILCLTTRICCPIHGGMRASAFGSYGWSGEAVPNLLERLRQLKMKVADEGFRARFKPTDADLTAATEFGLSFARSL